MKTVLVCALLVMAGLEGALGWDQELGWDQDELDLFDLVEEVGENFYSLLQVEESSSQVEIKRAFRQLSLKLHPDKSDDPDATEKFRQLVAVAEVLKDEQKRAWYDLILIEGLPDWRQPIYYYRHVRKMGFLELSILLLIITSVAHYLYGWAVFAEKQLVLQEVLGRKQKKGKKSTKSNRTISLKLEAEVEYRTAQAKESKPQLKNILPILLAKNCFTFYSFCLSRYSHWKSSKSNPSASKAERQDDQQEGRSVSHLKRKSNIKRSAPNKKDRSSESVSKTLPSSDVITPAQPKDAPTEGEPSPHVPTEDKLPAKNVPSNDMPSNGITSCFEIGEETVWSDESESEGQSEAVSKDSDSGTETMSDEKSKVIQGPTSAEGSKVTPKTASSNKSKVTPKTTQPGNNSARKCSDSELKIANRKSTQESGGEVPSTLVVGGSEEAAGSCEEVGWSQFQQRQLEWALSQYPKYSQERWENIAKAVPGKNMEDCVGRCKELFANVRKRKMDAAVSD